MSGPRRWLAVEGVALCPPHTGVGRYTVRLLDELLRQHPDLGIDVLILGFGEPDLRPLLAAGHDPDRFVVHCTRTRTRLYRMALAAGWAPSVERLFPIVRRDVGILYPNFVRYPSKLGLPEAVVLYDATFMLYPNDKPAWFRWGWRRLTQQALDSPASCVTISEAAREDLGSCFEVREQLPVLYPGMDLDGQPEHKRGPRTDDPYVLVVGTLSPRKNVDIVLAAWSLRGAGSPLRLVVVGLDHQPAAGVEVRGFVTDEELDALMDGAAALVAPSLNEGFDLPVIEAAARGVPVIASDIPVHREVLGEDWPLLFPPRDADALAQVLRRVPGLEAPEVPRSHRFTWERSGRRLGEMLGLA